MLSDGAGTVSLENVCGVGGDAGARPRACTGARARACACARTGGGGGGGGAGGGLSDPN